MKIFLGSCLIFFSLVGVGWGLTGSLDAALAWAEKAFVVIVSAAVFILGLSLVLPDFSEK